MTNWIREMLSRHGQRVIIRAKDRDTETRAFIQPVTERQEREPDGMTELGMLDGRLWLYLGRNAVGPADRIFWNEMEFKVRSSRPYYMGETMLYWWASLERAKEAAE